MEIVNWAGYHFLVYTPENARTVHLPGLYIFTKLTMDWAGNRTWTPLYVGQALLFATRLLAHERWSEAENLGANQIHLMTETNPYSRSTIENILIEKLQPRLNIQLR